LRNATHVRWSGREQITGANVLITILTEHESRAALQEQDLSRDKALKYTAIVTSTASMSPDLPPIVWKTPAGHRALDLANDLLIGRSQTGPRST
jgi:hypothetical protein